MENLLSDYYEFLKNETKLIKQHNSTIIIVPFFDSLGDAIQLIARTDGDEITIDDDSYTLDNLQMCGVILSNSRMKQIERTCLTFGVKLIDGKMQIKTNKKTFSNKLNSIIQCVLRVDDMHLTSSGRVVSYFLEDVTKFFDENEIFYTNEVSFKGATGFDFNFDFSFQRSKSKPERLCTLLNNGTKSSIKNALFAWNDTKPTRKEDSKFIIIINDENKVDDGVYEAASNYDATVVNFSNISESIELFQ